MDLYPNFNCNGRVNCNDWELCRGSLFLQKDVENVLYPQDDCPVSEDVRLFDSAVPTETVMLNLKHYNQCLALQLNIFRRHANYNQLFTSTTTKKYDFFHKRRLVSEYLFYLRQNLNSLKWEINSLVNANPQTGEDLNELFSILKVFLRKLKSIPDSTFHYAPSHMGNQSEQPEYHVYHMHIDLRWLYLTLFYTRSLYSQYCPEGQLDEFENVQGLIISDLMYISMKVFKRSTLSDLQQKTPYNCTCIRELWLMLQVFSDSLSERMKLKCFWDHVNECANGLLNNSGSESKEVPSCYSLPPCQNPEIFCLWIIYHLTLLYGYNGDGVYLGADCSRIRSNYDQIEKILKTYVSKGGKDGNRADVDSELCLMIPLLSSLVIDWCQPRVSIIAQLWECFHKRLNEPFLIQTTGPWTVSVEKKTAVDILRQVRDRIVNLENGKESSYGMFLRLLGCFLQKHYDSNNTKYWSQIKGRIFTKFSKNKVAELSVTGLYNFISLFITLAVCADALTVCKMMLDLLPPMEEFNDETNKRYNLIWKGKLVVLLLYNERKLHLGDISTSIINTVNIISCYKDDISRSMMTNFVDVLSTIFLSNDKFELGEHTFIGGWIDRYFLECSNRMTVTLIQALISVMEKCVSLGSSASTSGNVLNTLNALWSYVACRLRQLVFNPVAPNNHYQDLSKLAVLFTLEALRDPALAKKHKHSAVSLFQHFSASVMVKDIRISRCYLAIVLQQQQQAVQKLKSEIRNFDTLVIQAWIKCSILRPDDDKTEIKVLRDYVLQLNDIRKIFLTPSDLYELQNSDAPILVFMVSSMKKRNSLKVDQERNHFDAKWRQYFHLIEKWILIPITEETKDSDLACWIYTCIGTLILCTAPMLYTKVQVNNMLRNLINKTVLNAEQPFVREMGKKIFSMIVLGFEPLNIKADISLQGLIRELFEQYVPYLITTVNGTKNFKILDSLLKCFQDAKIEFLRLIFEILMSHFFIVAADGTIHKHSYLVMALLQNLLKGDKTYTSHVTEFIITICAPNVLACYMKVHVHHPHKQQTVEFIKNIVANAYYKENNTTKHQFNSVVSSAVQRFLPTFQQNTFELLRTISTIRLDIVKAMYPLMDRMLVEFERTKHRNAVSSRSAWRELLVFIKNGKGSYVNG